MQGSIAGFTAGTLPVDALAKVSFKIKEVISPVKDAARELVPEYMRELKMVANWPHDR